MFVSRASLGLNYLPTRLSTCLLSTRFLDCMEGTSPMFLYEDETGVELVIIIIIIFLSTCLLISSLTYLLPYLSTYLLVYLLTYLLAYLSPRLLIYLLTYLLQDLLTFLVIKLLSDSQ